MDPDEYQAFTKTTVVYPSLDQAKHEKIVEVMYLTLGLTGETGEIAEKVKKWYRDEKLDVPLIEKEIGDVCWYLARICDTLGLSFNNVLEKNVQKLSKRKADQKLHGSGDER